MDLVDRLLSYLISSLVYLSAFLLLGFVSNWIGKLVQARKIADVQGVKFKGSTDHTADETDPPGLQVRNHGPATAFDVWADIQLAEGHLGELSDTVPRLRVRQTCGLVGKRPSDVTPPWRIFGDTAVLARYGWRDKRGSHLSPWVVYSRE